MIAKIITITLMAAFYICYFAKMISQRKKGIHADRLGKPFWGRGYMPEAVREILRHGFEELGMNTIWCGYYEGNQKSKRVQKKVGFTYHHTCNEVSVLLMNEVRIGHTNIMKKEDWEKLYKCNSSVITKKMNESCSQE